jgi:hypothetical protein
VGIAALAAYNLALGAWMIVDPHSFYVALGPFGARNDHYIRDNATFSLALGAALMVAWSRPSWRTPLIAVSAAQFVIHALNHLGDINGAHPHWIGVFDFASLAGGAAVLVWLTVYSLRQEAPR